MARPTVDAQIRVRRHPERASYDTGDIDAILDAGFICHLAVVRDGRPVVIPTLYARDGDRLLVHGSPAAGMFRDAARIADVCVTVTHVDGLVLARSAFSHSINYRSVVIHGTARQITDDGEKTEALGVIVDHVARGQWDTVRRPTPEELRQTDVWSVTWTEASAKVRSGPPKDDEADLDLPIWAGVLPLVTTAGALIPDQFVAPDVAPPDHLLSWSPASSGAGDTSGK